MMYCAFEFLFAEVVDLHLKLDFASVKQEALIIESHGDALIINRHVESHLKKYISNIKRWVKRFVKPPHHMKMMARMIDTLNKDQTPELLQFNSRASLCFGEWEFSPVIWEEVFKAKNHLIDFEG